MKNSINKSLLILGVILASCDQERDIAPVIDPEKKAVITIQQLAPSSTVTEGDVLEFTITSDKMHKAPIDFTVMFNKVAEAAEHDVEIEGGVLAPYTTTTTMKIHVLAEDFPELQEELKLDIGAFDIAQNWRLSPNSDIEAVDVDIQNVNMDGVITLGLIWPDDHDDLDFYITRASTGTNWGGNSSAGGSYPEINTNLWPDDPNDTYYVSIDPYYVEKGVTDYAFHIGLEDGSVQIIEGTLDPAMIDSYVEQPGRGYRMLKIDILDGAITITNLNP